MCPTTWCEVSSGHLLQLHIKSVCFPTRLLELAHDTDALTVKMPFYAGVVQLLNSGHLPHDFWDWDFSAGFSWGPDAEEEEAQPANDAVGE